MLFHLTVCILKLQTDPFFFPMETLLSQRLLNGGKGLRNTEWFGDIVAHPKAESLDGDAFRAVHRGENNRSPIALFPECLQDLVP